MHRSNRPPEGDNSREAEKYKLARELADELFGKKPELESGHDYYGELESFCALRGYRISSAYRVAGQKKECEITISFPDQFGLAPMTYSVRDTTPARAKQRAAKELLDILQKDLSSG